MTEKAPVLQEFEKISAVPRRSYYNDKILAYCVSWAEENNFEYIFDKEAGNILIKKPASPGKENRPAVCLQGHLDMVAVSNPGIVHDWDNEGIDLIYEGDYVKGNGTTLGADNGVAAAIGFAVFKDETVHNPPLELLLTTDEEVGMSSVKNGDLSFVNAKYLLNLDSGPEGCFTTGCCGGDHVKAVVKNEREAVPGKAYKITLSGFKGGHSGMEITGERANALKVLGEVLYDLSHKCDFRISSLKSEGKDNAISNNAECVVITEALEDVICGSISETFAAVKNKYRITDPDILIEIAGTKAENALTKDKTFALAALLHLMPYGVQNFEQTLDFVETSANVGPVDSDENEISIHSSIRSSVYERNLEVMGKIDGICRLCGAEMVKLDNSYPAWRSNPDSEFLRIVCDIYENKYGKRPETVPTHGGLECGYIMAKTGLEGAVAIGPDNQGEHTPDEKLSVCSLVRT